MDALAILRYRAPTEVIDYDFVIDCLKNLPGAACKTYSAIKNGCHNTCKKGLYVFGPLFFASPLFIRNSRSRHIMKEKYHLQAFLILIGFCMPCVIAVATMYGSGSPLFINNFWQRLRLFSIVRFI